MFFDTISGLELNRVKAAHDTGSINNSNAWCLYSLTRYFKPTIIAEVGTFIGRSTISMDEALQDVYVRDAVIHTCDAASDISLDQYASCNIVQYPKKMSTEMLQAITSKVDMFFLDGRIVPEDVDLILGLSHNSSVIVLDDFEGTEKGVANFMALARLTQMGYTVFYPPDSNTLSKYGLFEYSNLAMIVPYNIIRFTNQ